MRGSRCGWCRAAKNAKQTQPHDTEPSPSGSETRRPPHFALNTPCIYPGGSQLLFPSPPFYCITRMSCPSDNAQAIDQSSFWTHGSLHWDAHRIGWAVAGGCSAAVSAITLWPKEPPDSYRPCERRPSSSLLSLFSITVGMPRSCVRRSTSELTWTQ